MNRNPFWLLFLFLIGSGATVHTAFSCYKVYRYQIFSLQIPVETVRWTVVPVNDQDFAVEADYTYRFDNIHYSGQGLWEEHYLNPYAAEEKKGKLAKRDRLIWINPSDPVDSSLQKNFPFKQCISSLFLWCVFGYFFYLGVSYGPATSGKSSPGR